MMRPADEPDRLPLSVAIITRNEQANLDRCLASIAALASEIVVIDSGSTDDTVRIAQRYGASVVVREWPGYRTQKNIALGACTQPWVLSLDADEQVSPELAADLRRALAGGATGVSGYEINRRTWYLGDWLWHAWYPEWRLRLVRRDNGEWVGGEIHETLAVDGATARLAGDLLHYSYEGLEDHFTRTVRYARLAADELVRRNRRVSWHKLILSPWGRFLKMLVLRGAWRDGWRGWLVAYSSLLAGVLKYGFVLERRISSAPEKGSKQEG